MARLAAEDESRRFRAVRHVVSADHPVAQECIARKVAARPHKVRGGLKIISSANVGTISDDIEEVARAVHRYGRQY